MFEFEQLEVYKKSEQFCKKIFDYLKNHKAIDRFLQYQLKRAATSIMLNIAEGAGRFGGKDKARFYIIAKGSLNEVVALLRFLRIEEEMHEQEYEIFYADGSELARILTTLAKNAAHS